MTFWAMDTSQEYVSPSVCLSICSFQVHFDQTWGQFNSGIGVDGQFQFWDWNCLFTKNRIGIDKLNAQINLPFIFLIKKYFFHDNPTWHIKLLGVGIPSWYSESLLVVKRVGKNRIGIDQFDLQLGGIEIDQMESTPCLTSTKPVTF